MQFCDHSRSSRYCGFQTSLDSEMIEIAQDDSSVDVDDDEYVLSDEITRQNVSHVSPIERSLSRPGQMCPILLSQMLATHFSSR